MNVGVMLAAGASRRMGRPKALVGTRDGSFASHGIRTLWAACRSVVVVLGADANRVRQGIEEEFVRLVEEGGLDHDLIEAHRHETQDLQVHFAVNRAWRRGMYGSVREGLRQAVALRPEMVVVMPVDHPAVRPTTVRDLATVMGQALAAARAPKVKSAFSYGLVPRFRRRRGHPIALSPALARAVARDDEAENLSDAVRRNARLVGFLDVKDAGVVRNVNAPGD